MQPVLESASRIIDWVEDLIKTYNTGGIPGVLNKMVTSAFSSIGSAISIGFTALWRGIVDSLPSWMQKLIKKAGLLLRIIGII